MTDDSLDEWTDDERARLAEVGRYRSPRGELKTRTMTALRERGLIGAGERLRPARRFTLGLAAAAAIVFAAGALAGYGVAVRRQGDARSDSTASGSSTVTREVARMDSAPTQGSTGRHVVWF